MKSKQTTSNSRLAIVCVPTDWQAKCRLGWCYVACAFLLILPSMVCAQQSEPAERPETSETQQEQTDKQQRTATKTSSEDPISEEESSDPDKENEKTKSDKPAATEKPDKTADLDPPAVDKKQLTESERRMQSLAKSYKKEDRPEKPSFNGRASKNGAITFDDLKFEMKKSDRFKRSMLTESINEFVGERVQLKGYIHPNSKKKGMKKFIFVRDDKECCFGPTAALYDCVLVTLDKDQKGRYTLRPVTVEGEFYLKEFNGPDGRVWAIYRMKNGVIKY